MKKILRVSLTVFLVGVLFCACFITTVAAKTTSGKIGKTITWIFDDETGTLAFRRRIPYLHTSPQTPLEPDTAPFYAKPTKL